MIQRPAVRTTAGFLYLTVMQCVIYVLCGLLGVITHLLLTFQSLRTDARKANANLTIGKFIHNDWPNMLLAIAPVFVWLLTFGEATKYFETLNEYVRLSFVMVGLSGSYMLQKAHSRSREWIREIVNRKTDIADNQNQK